MLGRAGSLAALPCRWEGWATFLGLGIPSLLYAVFGGHYGRLLAAGLLAFLFGLAYAMADEERRTVS